MIGMQDNILIGNNSLEIIQLPLTKTPVNSFQLKNVAEIGHERIGVTAKEFELIANEEGNGRGDLAIIGALALFSDNPTVTAIGLIFLVVGIVSICMVDVYYYEPMYYDVYYVPVY